MAGDSRRSTAAQYFMEEDVPAEEQVSTFDKVVNLLHEASLMTLRETQKLNRLKQVQDLIINKDPTLLDNFLDEILAFQSDKSVEVKRFIIGFAQEACKKDSDILPKVIPILNQMLLEDNVTIQKRTMLSLSQLIRVALQWISKAKVVTDSMKTIWEILNELKSRIISNLESDNDGIRTHAIKVMEGIALLFSRRTSESDSTKKQQQEFSLDQIPEWQTFFKVKKLEDEGKQLIETLLRYLASPHISSINLMTVMNALTTIAKQRPGYFSRVVQAFEALHVNLPPTLATSQVSSVRKNLKMQMLSLLRHPSSVDFKSQITTLLTDLGATQSEVMKAMPKIDETKKRKITEEEPRSSKKQKTEVELDDDDGGATPWVPRTEKPLPTDIKTTTIDITAEDLLPRFTSENVADLVLISMVMLPDTMPPHFQATYTPIAAAGTEAQIKHMSRLLATQLTTAGMGKGIAEAQRRKAETKEPDEGGASPNFEDPGTSPKQLIQTVVGGSVGQIGAAEIKKSGFAIPAPQQRKGLKQFKLSNVTNPLDRDQVDQMMISALKRILAAEKAAIQGNAFVPRVKILASLVAQIGGELKHLLQDFIFEDLRNRSELAFAWLYQEYANGRGYNTTVPSDQLTLASYDECLTRLLNGLLEMPDHKEGLFARLLLEAPAITDNAVQIMKKYCMDENRMTQGMAIIKELIQKRPVHKVRFLHVLLDFTWNEKLEVRNHALRVVKKLHDVPELRLAMEKYALVQLKYLLHKVPPPLLLNTVKVKEPLKGWTEDTIKLCLYLYLGLLPSNHKLMHELATVYTAASADIKRCILRVLENPVKGMGMQSPELLLFVENCPKGAETLVTRVIHILTDKASPSPELVERVRDLYHKRVPDVRFLIPVLTGLQKKEVVNALPKLIKLNPVVVKEVFNRLLGSHAGDSESYTSPLSPAELLIALHNIDPTKCDMKTIIKATNMCFGEKKVYTQEILAVVLQQLMEQTPLPTLLMRTVIQSLSMYPRLIGFVMNILLRLITKQVWKQKKVWEGFIRCCQRTKPQSFQVLLQLPPPQLKNVFEVSPDLREPLLKHVLSFTPHQRAHIQKTIMNVLETDPAEEQKAAEKKATVEKEKLAKKQEEEERLAKEKLQQKLDEEKAELKRIAEANESNTGKSKQDPKIKLETNIDIKETPESTSKEKESQRQAEEELIKKKKAEEEAKKKKSDEEAKKKKAEEEAKKKKSEEEAKKKKAEEEAKKKKADEEAKKKKSEEEAKKKKADEEAKKKKAEEEAKKKKAEEEAKKKKAEEEAKKKKAEEEAKKKKAEDEAKKKKAEEEANKKKIEEEALRKAEIERKQAEASAKKKAELVEAAKRKAELAEIEANRKAAEEVEARRLAEEEEAAKKLAETADVTMQNDSDEEEEMEFVVMSEVQEDENIQDEPVTPMEEEIVEKAPVTKKPGRGRGKGRGGAGSRKSSRTKK